MEDLPIQLANPAYYQDKWDLSTEEFQHAVAVYATNQDHFVELNDAKALERLERWFLRVVEPVPDDDSELDDWLKRELCKKNGYSYSCSRAARAKFRIRDTQSFEIYSTQLQKTLELFNSRRSAK